MLGKTFGKHLFDMRLGLFARVLACVFGLVAASSVFAVDQSSSNFQNTDPTFVPSFFHATSGNFQVSGSLEPIVGLSTTTTFHLRHGVLLKEVVTPAPPSPTPR